MTGRYFITEFHIYRSGLGSFYIKRLSEILDIYISFEIILSVFE